MNKLDLKDYLYNLYGVQALHIRSYIIHGKVRRHRQTNRLVRASQQKKMTIEMKPGDNFVWPEVPAEVEEKKNSAQNEAVKMEREEQKENRSEQGQYLGNTAKKEKKGLREKARALLEGKVKWRPGWEESGTRMLPLEGEARSSASV